MKKIVYAFMVLALFGCEDKEISTQLEHNTSKNKEIKKVIKDDINLSDPNIFDGSISGSGGYEKSHYLNKKELAKYEKSAYHGDRRSAYILAWHYNLSGYSDKGNYWLKKSADMGDLSAKFIKISQLIDNLTAQNRLKKKWHMDDDRYFIHELNDKDIAYLIQKTNHGDKIATYVLAQHYHFKDKSKYIFWLEKSANSGDMSSRHNFISECIEYPKLPCHKDVPNMVKKWQMEYFFPDYKETK